MTFPIIWPQLDPLSDRTFVLTEDYQYEWVAKNNTCYKLIVPTGFETDIASVPRWVWSVFGILPDGLHRGAAVLHDFLYFTNKPKGTRATDYHYKLIPPDTWENISHVVWTRKQCDRLFMRVMKESGVGPKKRWAMFKAVRLFGRWGWQK
ncbi:MAG: DUF1353 domain-containing protein [Cyanobacteria bacterium P01_H01_bin.74]